MKTRVILLTIVLALISNLSFSQTDSLLGKEVTVHLHKTKHTVIGEYRCYKNNRVTVLFDNNLHDYFYPEVKLLQFEGFNLRFSDKGNFVDEQIIRVPKSNLKAKNNIPNNSPSNNKKLIVMKSNGQKFYTINLNKKIKVRIKNYDIIKSKWVEILNDSTLKFHSRNFKSHQIVTFNEIIQIKGYKIQPEVTTVIGNVTTFIGVVTSPYLIGVPIIIASKYIIGYKSKYLYEWDLVIQ